jgi:thymidylate kinase
VPVPTWRTRLGLLDALAATLESSGVRWAFQGATGAPQAWTRAHGLHDLDLWVERMPAELADLLDARPGARTVDTDDQRRLRHVSWAVLLDSGPAVVDVTVGDLRVGAVLTVPSYAVRVSGRGGVLAGSAAVADLLVRPVLRGRVPTGPRLAEARRAWRAASPWERDALRARLHEAPGGRSLTEAVVRLLEDSEEPSATDVARLLRLGRRVMVRATLAPGALPATWAQRRSIAPLGRGPAPFGVRSTGAVVVLVGTDGSGKSTVQRELCERLEELDVPTRSAYFGMAHGNLPGVGLARRLLGVTPVAEGGASTDAAPTPDRAAPAPSSLAHPRLRRVAAYAYAAEYVWRYLHLVAPHVARNRVVVCDRWITDLRHSPWPGSRASWLLERVLPAPDVLVLPDAPDEVIHRRKPERTLAEQSEQQRLFRELAGEQPARVETVVLDTASGPAPDVTPALTAVLRGVHRASGRRR